LPLHSLKAYTTDCITLVHCITDSVFDIVFAQASFVTLHIEGITNYIGKNLFYSVSYFFLFVHLSVRPLHCIRLFDI